MFGLSLGFSKNKSKNTIDQTTTSSPDVPDWLNNQVQGQSKAIADLGASTDPASLVPGADPLQTKAGGLYGNLADDLFGGMDLSGDYAAAGDALKSLASGPASYGGASLLDGGLDQYFNPYKQHVIDTSLDAFDRHAAEQESQGKLDAVKSGAFRGSGVSLTNARNTEASGLARGQLAAGLYDQGFNSATGLAATDAGFRNTAGIASMQSANATRGAAAAGLASLAGQRASSAQSAAGGLFDVGGGMRDISQAQATAPLDLQAWLNEQYGTLPANLFVGQTDHTTGTSTGKSSGFNVGASFGK